VKLKRLLGMVGWLFMQQPSFGKLPTGQRLARIKQSPQYKDGAFQNETFTPNFTNGATFFSVLKKMFFEKKVELRPSDTLPTYSTSLDSLSLTEPYLMWLGHSSYYMQIDGQHLLIDPVFSERTSPVSYAGTKAFTMDRTFSLSDFPLVDIVVITHDHYDHLDYATIKALATQNVHFITSLGVGEHLEYWGIAADRITELDWWEQSPLMKGLQFTATPARHFSGRGLKRNQSLWSSFVVKTKNLKIFIGGDSGYDQHFKTIGEKLGPFDIAILECGQYNNAWANIHMMPEETAQAARDLHAACLLPVHWSKFALSDHRWKEPIERVVAAANTLNMTTVTPMIGQPVVLGVSDYPQQFWWRKVH
jgi:L-ascorbate metabolism protein UlaG (beta-lactamase superfamily)